MDEKLICSSIVECLPYPVVFVDLTHTIRYMNRAARFYYHEERGHSNLIGQSIFDCHYKQASCEKIEAFVEYFEKDSKEKFLGVSDRNLRIYVSPVRGPEGDLIGYYERFEMNLQK